MTQKHEVSKCCWELDCFGIKVGLLWCRVARNLYFLKHIISAKCNKMRYAWLPIKYWIGGLSCPWIFFFWLHCGVHALSCGMQTPRVFCFFNLILLISFCLCQVFVAVSVFLQLQCMGFSCRAQTPRRASVVAAHELSSCSSQTLEHRLNSCGAQTYLLRDLWNLPRPGIEPLSPALADGFFASEPPGKSRGFFCLRFFFSLHHVACGI